MNICLRLMQAEHSGTSVIENPEKIIEKIREWILDSNELSVCLSSGGMQFSYDYFFQTTRGVLDKYRRGEHKGVRFITFIDKDNTDAVKNYLDAGAKIKHVRNLPPMSTCLSEKKVLTTLEKMEGGKVVQSTLVSNDVAYIKYFAGIFDELWDKGINAIERMKDIKEGRETDDELADARQYVNLVLEEVSSMKNKVAKQ
jgi:two-component system, OmpR family, sensor histidine kinase VicK